MYRILYLGLYYHVRAQGVDECMINVHYYKNNKNSECATTVDGFAPIPAVEKRSEPSANSSRAIRWTDRLAVWRKGARQICLSSSTWPQPSRVKRPEVCRWGQSVDRTFDMQRPSVKTDLVGHSNEVDICIEGIQRAALLDTGASISTVSEAFHREKLSHLPIQHLQDFLHIECDDGESLPYSGYIAADNTARGVGLGEKHSQPCLLLVVPDSRYNAKVPVLLGTNILEQFLDMSREKIGHRFLRAAKLHTPWYLSFRCMVLREKELARRKNRLEIVKSAENRNIIVQPNSTHLARSSR